MSQVTLETVQVEDELGSKLHVFASLLNLHPQGMCQFYILLCVLVWPYL